MVMIDWAGQGIFSCRGSGSKDRSSIKGDCVERASNIVVKQTSCRENRHVPWISSQCERQSIEVPAPNAFYTHSLEICQGTALTPKLQRQCIAKGI